MVTTTSAQPQVSTPVKSGRSQRKWRNLVIKPRAQVELVLNIIILTVFFGATISVVVHNQLGRIFEVLYGAGFLDERVTNLLDQDWQVVMVWLAVLIILYLLTLSFICLIHSHRMIGPNIAFQRQLRAMISKNYGARVKLRYGDYYQEVADLFNELSKNLEEESQQSLSDKEDELI
ncbi:MAG: hypothetical protein OXC44_01770 [Proteobacteria bacterium]|nr:hypothetical protein [Pseudomonadota bacterium]